MCRAPFVLKKSFIFCFFTVIFYFKNQGNNQNNFKKIKKSKQIEVFIFFVFCILFEIPGAKPQKDLVFFNFVFSIIFSK